MSDVTFDMTRNAMEVHQNHAEPWRVTLVLEWAQKHRAELMEDWELCAHNQSPKKIRPLP